LRARAEAALAAAPPDAALRDALGRVIDEADALIRTFDALLLIARLEAGALEGKVEHLDLSELARDVAELYAPVAEEAGLQIDVAAPDALVVDANRQLIGQAIANLIDNAIKYGAPAAAGDPANAAITVAVARRDDAACVTIADHGPGIATADRARALKRFVRLDRSRSKPGTGLGLSLVAAVARLHKGRLELGDNSPGLRVELLVPLRPDTAHAGQPGETEDTCQNSTPATALSGSVSTG
jgi:signal transduction histidine kinase